MRIIVRYYFTDQMSLRWAVFQSTSLLQLHDQHPPGKTILIIA